MLLSRGGARLLFVPKIRTKNSYNFYDATPRIDSTIEQNNQGVGNMLIRRLNLRVLLRRKRTLCQLLLHLFFQKDLVRDHRKLQQSDLKQIFHRVSVTNRKG